MKKSIRFGVFETNSSSTHSLTMCSSEDYDKWVNGDVLLNDNWNFKGQQWITKEKAIEYLKEKSYYNEDDDLEELLAECEFYTENKYFDDEYLEGYSETYTTANGDEVVAFGKFGYNG